MTGLGLEGGTTEMARPGRGGRGLIQSLSPGSKVIQGLIQAISPCMESLESVSRLISFLKPAVVQFYSRVRI